MAIFNALLSLKLFNTTVHFNLSNPISLFMEDSFYHFFFNDVEVKDIKLKCIEIFIEQIAYGIQCIIMYLSGYILYNILTFKNYTAPEPEPEPEPIKKKTK